MRQPKTVHTAAETPQLKSVTIPVTWISAFTRHDQTSATVKFRSRPNPAQLKEIIGKMGWSAPSYKDAEKKCDGKFSGGHFILSASTSQGDKEKLKVASRNGAVDTQAEVDIEYKSISAFQLLRMEIEGKRGKGFRWELRFEAATGAPDAAANLESYMLRTDNARGSLAIKYIEEPEQQSLLDVRADPEAQQRVLEEVE